MKKIITIFAILILCMTNVFAQMSPIPMPSFPRIQGQKTKVFIDQYTNYDLVTGQLNAEGFIWTSTDLTKNLGLFSFSMLNLRLDVQAYAGPKLSVGLKNGSAEIGVGAGFKVHEYNNVKGIAYFFLETKKDSSMQNKTKTQVMLCSQYAPTGEYWYFGYYTYGVTNSFAVGVHTQKSSATGLRFQYDRNGFMTYFVPGIDVETGHYMTQIGFRLYL